MSSRCCGDAPSVLDGLVARRADYVAFVTAQVHDASLAEDIVQASLLKASERLTQLDEEGSASSWFYRMLRNAVLDQRRREGALRRGAERFAAENGEAADAVERVPRPCRCVTRALDGLKPEYAEALRRVDIDETPVKDFAVEQSTTANNAGVRLFRARAALKQKVVLACGSCSEGGGCLDCTCPDFG